LGLILAFDTATRVATSTVVVDGEVLGERISRAATLLEDLDDLIREVGAEMAEISALVVGTGPGSFTGIRIGLSTARGLAFALNVPVAGVSTLDALAAGAPGAIPVIDAGRREIFTTGPRCLRPEELELDPGMICVGDGALRYRPLLEAAGAEIPPDESELHLPRARFHAALARGFGPAESVEPIYLRAPDAEKTVA
jgi:tRNA threonylcarbamoyladenosine biosynthesis protein TsaB